MKKETLEREYYENDLTLKQIAEKYNRTYTSMYKLLVSYELKTKNKIKAEKSLTLEQEKFVYAKLMGDGCITKSRHHAEYHFEFSHEEKQREYALECLKHLIDWGTYAEKTRHRDPKIYKKHTWVECTYKSIHNNDFSRIYRNCYEYGRKIVNNTILDIIDEQGLAIWYMDDGHIDSRSNNAGYLNTLNFTLEENKLIVNWLWDRFQVRANTVKAGRSRNGKDTLYRIRLSASTFKHFCEIVEPYIVDCVKYKIGKDIVQS